MRRIILMCGGGMSSSILANNMKKAAQEIGYEADISAHSLSEYQKHCKDADIVLLGPQIRFRLDIIRAEFPDIKIETIDMRDYGMMDGKSVIKHVMKVLGN